MDLMPVTELAIVKLQIFTLLWVICDLLLAKDCSFSFEWNCDFRIPIEDMTTYKILKSTYL